MATSEESTSIEMYVDKDSQRSPKYEDYRYNGLRIEDVEECKYLPENIPQEHTVPVRKICEDSILIIAYTVPDSEEGSIYKPFYVHRYVEESGLLVCEDCNNPKSMFIEGGDGDQHLLPPSKYDTVMSDLVDRNEYDYTLSTYPLSVLGLIEGEHEYISASKSVPSDEWLASQLDIDSELVRYYI
jgi:hypothetical protein